jgi:hypothetical protein
MFVWIFIFDIDQAQISSAVRLALHFRRARKIGKFRSPFIGDHTSVECIADAITKSDIFISYPAGREGGGLPATATAREGGARPLSLYIFSPSSCQEMNMLTDMGYYSKEMVTT